MRLLVAAAATLALGAGIISGASGSDGSSESASRPSRIADKRVRGSKGVRTRGAEAAEAAPGSDVAERAGAASSCDFSAIVVDGSGAPVSGAVIRVVGAFGSVFDGSTDESGGAGGQLTASGAVRCIASSGRLVPAASAWAMAAPGRPVEFGTLVLEEGERIEGIVRDDWGNPVPNVCVSIRPMDREAVEHWIGVVSGVRRSTDDCDETGRFVIRGIPRGRYLLRFSPPGPCSWWGADTVAETGGDPVAITMPARYVHHDVEIDVRAEDESGGAIREFRAELKSWVGFASAAAVDGRARLGVRDVAPFRLLVCADGFDDESIADVHDCASPVVVRMRRSRPAEKPPSVLGTVEFEGAQLPRGSELSVALLQAGGTADIDAAVARTEVGSESEFALQSPSPGSFRIVVWGRVRRGDEWCGVAGNADVVAGDSGVRIPVRALQPIRGVVRLPDGLAPDEVWVTVTDEGTLRRTRTETFRGTSSFEFPEFDPGSTYRVGVSVRAGEEWFRGEVFQRVIAGGPPVEACNTRGISIEGRVVRDDGTPVAGALVWTASERPHARSASTDVDGRFRLTGLREGFERLHASSPGLQAATDSVPVAAGETAARIELTPKTFVRR